MNAQAVIKLLVVDDQPVVRDGLRRIQELEPRLQIVGEADTELSAVAAAQRLRPDVILMDIRLPDGDGIEACRRIKALLPEVHVLFLTSYADNRFVLASMEAGADGYLLKESGSQRIVDAIHSLLNGGTNVTNKTNALNFGMTKAMPWYGGNLTASFNNGRTDTSRSLPRLMSPLPT